MRVLNDIHKLKEKQYVGNYACFKNWQNLPHTDNSVGKKSVASAAVLV